MEVLPQERVLTKLDHARLTSLLARSRAGLPPKLAALAEEILDFADVVEATEIAADVVTMRSRVQVARAGEASVEFTLSYPVEGSPPPEGTVSVLTPMGLSLLGARTGQTVSWTGPTGEPHTAQVLEVVYQPEAAGDYGA